MNRTDTDRLIEDYLRRLEGLGRETVLDRVKCVIRGSRPGRWVVGQAARCARWARSSKAAW